MISEDTVSQVRNANDIVEVVAEFVPNLKRAGKDFKALCPFHQEKTPSFMVSPGKGIFHCFGCGKGGDVFKFVMEMDGCSYPEAIEKLADKKGIAIKKGVSSAVYSREYEKRKKLLHILERAAQFYHKSLLESEEAEEARAYLLEKRKLTPETIKKFRLGWASGSGKALLATALKSGFAESDLAEAGLLMYREGRWIDWFRKRILFPIYDMKGQVLGFGGRILESQKWAGDHPPPKYLNSPETAVFHKGQNLYGLYQGAQEVRQKKEIVVLEGYMDVIGCHQAGYGCAVAPLGTSLTSDQCQLLKRYVDQVTLLFDADQAGESAAVRGSEVMMDFGFLPMVARLPEKVDADEYLQKHSLEDFIRLLQKRVSVVEFKMETLWSKNQNAPMVLKKALVSQSVMPLILKIQDAIVQTELIKLVSVRLNISEASLLVELKKKQGAEKKPWRSGSAENAPESGVSPQAGDSGQSADTYLEAAEVELFCLALQHLELRPQLIETAEAKQFFTDPKAAECFAALKARPQGKVEEIAALLGETASAWLRKFLLRPIKVSKPFEIFDSLVRQIEMRRTEKERKNVEHHLIESINRGESPSATDASQYRNLNRAVKGKAGK